MVKDLVPGLLKQIEREFANGMANSRKLFLLLDKLEKHMATYADANEQAIEVGEILARVFAETIKPEDLPDGIMYYNIAERIIDPTLKTNHHLVTAYASDVQKTLNEKAGLRIKPQIPEVNQERIDGIVKRISSEPFKNVKWLLGEPVVNFTQSIVDDMVRENANFQYNAGLQPKIVRKSSGDCCEWCDNLVGIYGYPDGVPLDVWRRHRFCRCTVEYDPGKGKRENVHTKRRSGSKEDIEARAKLRNKQWDEVEKEREKRRRSRIEKAKKLNQQIETRKQSPYDKETLAELEQKKWSIAFKNKAIKFYRNAHDAGLEFNSHAVARVMDRARSAGLSYEDVVSACKGLPRYIQEDGRLVYNTGKNIYLIQDPETGSFVSCVKREKLRRDWLDLGDE
ncbi:MAG: hypothetical protein Q4E09_06035 [Eubacteriales bacterium]|nr:hypothetical protein [Eubacteriales bacterium]